MAKVKIQGNASGTGILTVTAPNTSTDRTITLPDSTDTLAVNSDVTNKLPLAGGTMTGDLEIDTGNKTRIVIGDNGSDLSTVDLCRSDTSIGTSNDLGAVTFSGEDNTGNVRTAHAMILGESDGTHSAGDNPTRISFWTTPSGSSTMTERMRILAGGGITFNGDTSSDNALDDYETGSWTGSGTTGAGTMTVNEETYTKIGRLVHLYFEVDFSGASGNLTVTGLPFTASPDGAVGIGREDASNGYAVYARINVSNQIQVYYAGSASNATPFVASSGNFKISITYQV
jgi:hypothetical protein